MPNKSHPMKVLMTVDPEMPVPPTWYGGIERIVEFLVVGLQKRGISVVLVAHPNSTVEAPLRPWPTAYSRGVTHVLNNMLHLKSVYQQEGPFNLIHSFSRLAYLSPFWNSTTSLIQSYQRHVSSRSVRWGTRFHGEKLRFTGCSEYLTNRGKKSGGVWFAVPNGVCLEKYQFQQKVDDSAPLIFLGRLDRVKGAHHAIAIAKKTGRPLILAGNRPEQGEDKEYFDQQIKPHLADPNIQYVGSVNDNQKNELLGKAAALLFPIEWDEPFGIVMAEAMACGTPVIAFDRGAVPEVVQQGVTGWKGRTLDDLIQGAEKWRSFDRRQCRENVEQKYSADVIVEKYLQIYQECDVAIRSH